MAFQLEEGRQMGPPEILHNFYCGFALWPRDICSKVALGKKYNLFLEASKQMNKSLLHFRGNR